MKALREFELSLQLKQRAAGIGEKLPEVPIIESTVSLGNIAWNRHSCPSQLNLKTKVSFFGNPSVSR